MDIEVLLRVSAISYLNVSTCLSQFSHQLSAISFQQAVLSYQFSVLSHKTKPRCSALLVTAES